MGSRRVVKLLFFCMIVYGVLCVLLFFVQKRFIYFPYPEMVDKPDQLGLRFQDVSFQSVDGLELHGWIVEPRDYGAAARQGEIGANQTVRGNILFFHGNAGNISHNLETLQLFAEVGYRVFAFDYRGYGLSEGRPDEQGLYDDGEGAIRFFCDEFGLRTDELVYLGRSLGGAVALEMALRRTPAALVLESTFTSVRDMGGMLRYLVPLRLILTNRFDNLSKVSRVTCPLLVIHSEGDELVPVQHGHALFDAADARTKEFLEITGGHNDGFIDSGDFYSQGIDRFLREHAK